MTSETRAPLPSDLLIFSPAAVAVLYAAVRDGNTALDADDLAALALHLGRTRAMLAVLGLDPDDPVWSHGAGAGAGPELRPVVDGLVAALVEQRAAARARKDYPAADAVRDALATLGVVLEDTPRGTRWSLTSPSQTSTGA